MKKKMIKDSLVQVLEDYLDLEGEDARVKLCDHDWQLEILESKPTDPSDGIWSERAMVCSKCRALESEVLF